MHKARSTRLRPRTAFGCDARLHVPTRTVRLRFSPKRRDHRNLVKRQFAEVLCASHSKCYSCTESKKIFLLSEITFAQRLGLMTELLDLPGALMWQALERNLLDFFESLAPFRAHNEPPRHWPPRDPARQIVEQEMDETAAWAALGWAASLEVRGLLQIFAGGAEANLQADLKSIWAILHAQCADDVRPMLDFVQQVLQNHPATQSSDARAMAPSDSESVSWLRASLQGEEALLVAWKYRSLKDVARAHFEQELRVFEQTLASTAREQAESDEGQTARVLMFPSRKLNMKQPAKLQLAADSESHASDVVRDPENGVFLARCEVRLENPASTIEIEIYRFGAVLVLYAEAGELLLEVRGQSLPATQQADGYAEFEVLDNIAVGDIRVAYKSGEGQSIWQSPNK